MRIAFSPLAALMAALVLAAPLLAAQEHRAIVVQQLDTASRMLAEHGFRPDQTAISRDQVIGILANESMAMFELTLQAGGSYMITGFCDEDCRDLDLELYTEAEGTLVAQDVEDDDVPILEFTSPATGQYMLAISMVDCSTRNCYFGVRVYRRQ